MPKIPKIPPPRDHGISQLIFEKRKKRYLYISKRTRTHHLHLLHGEEGGTFRSAKTDGFRVIYCHDSWDRGGIGGARRWTEASVVSPLSTPERYLIWGAQCAPRNAPRILTYILLAVGLIPLFDNAPGLVSDVRGKNKRRRSSPAPRHPSWPVAASSPSTVCELDAVTRIDLVARPIYIGPSNVLCRAAGRVQRGKKTACRASQGRAGQGRAASRYRIRWGPWGTLEYARGPPRNLEVSRIDRRCKGSTRTDSVWSCTRGYAWATSWDYVTRCCCAMSRIMRIFVRHRRVVLSRKTLRNEFATKREDFWRINVKFWSYFHLMK